MKREIFREGTTTFIVGYTDYSGRQNKCYALDTLSEAREKFFSIRHCFGNAFCYKKTEINFGIVTVTYEDDTVEGR